MTSSKRVGQLWRVGGAALIAGAMLVTAACSSSKSSGGSSSSSSSAAAGGSSSAAKSNLPSVVQAAAITEASGSAGFAGAAADKGYELAEQQINDQHFLGSTTLKIDEQDNQSSAQTSASLVSAAIANKDYSAIFGPLLSNDSVAAAPIAQKSQMPIIFTQAGSDGVVIGDYTFRATAPMSTYYEDLAGKYLQSKGVKTLGLMYTTSTPTLAQLGTTTIPDMAKKYGITITSTTTVQSTTTDFSAPISKLIGGKPDAVAMLLVGAQNPTAMTALRQAGYTSGVVLGNAGAGAGNLKPAGSSGAGMTWPTDFSALSTDTNAQAFVTAYTAKFGSAPLNYAAEAYDAAWMLARALKQSGSADRADVQKGLAAVAKTGFTGAEGKITFVGNDMRVPGTLVQWNGTAETLVSAG
jgi:branched-chain amino acid transport system substrate-binding protein